MSGAHDPKPQEYDIFEGSGSWASVESRRFREHAQSAYSRLSANQHLAETTGSP